jgi:hypothetical protein
MRDEAEKTGGFLPHPIGKFKFKVIEASLKKGSTGYGQIFARFENVDVGPNQGKTVVSTMSPHKNDGTTNGWFFQQLGALGFVKDHPIWGALAPMDDDQGLGYIATNLIGCEVMCEITHREWANETQDNVKKMTPVDTTGVVPAQALAPADAAPVPVAPVPVPAAPVAPATVPVPVAPVSEPAPPAPLTVPVAPAPSQVPVPVAVAPAPAPVPVAPAPVPVAAVPDLVTPAAEPVAVPTTVEAVVAQIPTPAPAPIPTPPDRPF